MKIFAAAVLLWGMWCLPVMGPDHPVPIIYDIGLIAAKPGDPSTGSCALTMGIRVSAPARFKLERRDRTIRHGTWQAGSNRITIPYSLFAVADQREYILTFQGVTGGEEMRYALLLKRRMFGDPIVEERQPISTDPSRQRAVALEVAGKRLASTELTTLHSPPPDRFRKLKEIIAAPGAAPAGASISIDALVRAVRKGIRRRRFGPPPMPRETKIRLRLESARGDTRSVEAAFSISFRPLIAKEPVPLTNQP